MFTSLRIGIHFIRDPNNNKKRVARREFCATDESATRRFWASTFVRIDVSAIDVSAAATFVRPTLKSTLVRIDVCAANVKVDVSANLFKVDVSANLFKVDVSAIFIFSFFHFSFFVFLYLFLSFFLSFFLKLKSSLTS